MPLSVHDDCFHPANESPSAEPADVTRPLPPRPARRRAPLPAWTFCTPTPPDPTAATADPAWLEFLGVDATAADAAPDDPWRELLRR